MKRILCTVLCLLLVFSCVAAVADSKPLCSQEATAEAMTTLYNGSDESGILGSFTGIYADDSDIFALVWETNLAADAAVAALEGDTEDWTTFKGMAYSYYGSVRSFVDLYGYPDSKVYIMLNYRTKAGDTGTFYAIGDDEDMKLTVITDAITKDTKVVVRESPTK